MMLPGHGLGRDSNNASGYAAFGFGIKSLTGAIEAAISFATNVDIETVRTLTANKDISFALDMLLSAQVLSQIISASISFDLTALQDELAARGLSAEASLDLNTFYDILVDRAANVETVFDLQQAVDIVTQIDYNPNIVFNAAFDADFIKQLETDLNINFDIELTEEQVGFLIQFFLSELHVYVVPDELRFLKVFAEQRSIQVSAEARELEIEFEDRVVIIPQKYEEN